jgi:hypothetical protein
MSLLDDVSIVVTPNGYKAGELYAAIPIPTEGSELVVNSDFSSNTWWGLDSSWTISGGSANSNGTGTMYKGGILTIGKRYIVKVDVSAYTSGSLSYPNASYNIPSLIGTYTFDYVAVSQTISFTGTSFVGSIDNVSVKEYTSADMDVTRATAATRVDENGLVNYAEIITGSNIITDGDFPNGSTAWALNGWTISDNAANCSGITANMIQTISGSTNKTYSLTFTISNYVSGSVTPAFVGGYDDSLNYSSNGTFTEVISSASDTRFVFYGASFNGSIDNVSVKEVTRDNVPRIDYTGGGCPHILAEPQRTNLFEYSESFNNIEWSRSSVTVVDNSSQSPDGTNNASLMYPSSSGDFRYIHNSTIDSNSIYTISAFVKASGKNVVWFYINSGSQNGYIYYDLSDETTQVVPGSAGTPTATITSYGNDWYKISFTTGTAFAIGSGSGIGVSDAKGDPAVTANGTDGVLVWGLQLEAGSYATSYIPTSGSTVTRNKDIFSRDGIGSLINSTEGVLFVEMAALSNDGTFRIISLTDGGTTNRVSLIYNTLNNSIRVMVVSTSTVFDTSNSVTSTLDFHKIAIKWKLNDFAVWIDGVEVATDTSGNAPVGLDRIVFDVGNGTLDFYGKVKQLQVYNTSLSDEQLLQLTGESGTDFYESYAEMASALTYTIQ